MVLANPPLAEPVTDPGGVINKPPFEMGVANWMREEIEEFENSDTVYEQADAIIDLLYYAIGSLVEMGVKPDELFMLVHEYNVKKLIGKWCDGDGKVMKPIGWQHPDKEIREIIDAMM